MRRPLLLLTAGLAVFTFGCSSSGESASTTSSTAASSSTTSSVVVSAANKPACDAIAAYKNAADVPLTVTEGGDPTENAMKIQAFVATLIAPLQAVEAAAPAELKEPLGVLVTSGQSLAAADPASPAGQSEINNSIMAPAPETKAAQTELFTWSADNCGIDLKR